MRAVCLTALFLALGAVRAATPPGGEAHVLVASSQTAAVSANALYAERPLTVECWAKLAGARGYNILVANEPKASAAHWEIFTQPTSGWLTAYLPGCRPDHVRSTAKVVDGQWHCVALVLEEQRARLFVDGKLVGEQALTRPGGTRVPGAGLAIGTLESGEIGCDGAIASVRLSRGVRAIVVPSQPWEPDAQTIGLWRFDQPLGERVRDLSATGADALVRRPVTVARESGIWPRTMPGGMSAAFRPLPPAEEVGEARRLLAQVVHELKLASVEPELARDGLLRYWLAERRAWRRDPLAPGALEYPQSRPRTWADPQAVAAQTVDRHALVWPSDRGPLDTVLRRTGALRDWLRRAHPTLDLRAASSDLAALQVRDNQDDTGLYLAACAVRRQLALANPLLDFDALLCVARGTFEGSARSNPSTNDIQGGHFVTQYFGFNALPGGGLYVLRDWRTQPRLVDVLRDAVVTNGPWQGRRLTGGAFATPDLAPDGRRIVFAWTANREHRWVYSERTVFHLFRVNADGTGLTQLSFGPCNDFDPCWLPDGRIAFVSERRGGYIRCFGDMPVRTYTLFAMDADGSDIVPLSYYETSEWNPSVNHDGNLVYTRWDYTDRENCLGTRLWISGPDGTDPRAPHGNYPHPYHTFPDHRPWARRDGREIDSRIGAPLVEMGIRAIPGSPRYVCTAAPHHGAVYGSLCLLDLRVPDDGHMAQVKRLTPDEPFPESELDNRRHYKYGTPWPLSEDFHLANAWENLVLVDRFGNKELLAELELAPCAQDERLRLVDPIPLRPRPNPPRLPARTRTGAPATLGVVNVYDSDLPFPPDTKIRWLRVTQNILKENHLMGVPLIGFERENTPRIPLGIVPVEADGSAYFEAPVAKELIFQVLDEQHRAVQSMRSCAFVHPGEQLTCQGCHERTQRAPRTGAPPLAMRRAPSRLQPELGAVEPISYHRQIRPIIERTCQPCHTRTGKGPQDMRYEALRDDAFWFSGAMWQNMITAYSGIHGGSRTIPGRFGARHCRLGRALFDANHLQRVSATERLAFVVWLDSNSPRLGAYRDEAAQVRGELVWPVLDVDLGNLLGVETGGKPLRRNLWHEEGWGPYPCLVSEHQHDRVVLLDARGQVTWEYGVPHPQDAWLLANGNVLTTWREGVREVTRDKRVVWEYRTQAPSEVPACQPLPNGHVLVGVVGACRLLELDRAGQIVKEVPLSTTERAPHAQFRFARQTSAGTYLVPFTAEGAVREYDGAGQVLREFPRQPSPVAALRLPDGHTLISAGGAVTEYDRDNQTVWRIDGDWLPDIRLGTLAGLQRLPNGNTIVCNWNTRDQGEQSGAHVFEVTPDKRVVWQITGQTVGQVAHCQVLTPDLRLRPAGDVR